MQLGGWIRLWVLMTVLWGCAVASFAWESRPRIDSVRSSWRSEGLELVAQRINEKEGSDITPDQVATHKGFDTSAKAIAFFERVEANPSENQQIFEEDVTAVNNQHRALIQEIERGSSGYWLTAIAAWLGPMLGLLALGFAIRWVWRGFSRAKT